MVHLVEMCVLGLNYLGDILEVGLHMRINCGWNISNNFFTMATTKRNTITASTGLIPNNFSLHYLPTVTTSAGRLLQRRIEGEVCSNLFDDRFLTSLSKTIDELVGGAHVAYREDTNCWVQEGSLGDLLMMRLAYYEHIAQIKKTVRRVHNAVYAKYTMTGSRLSDKVIFNKYALLTSKFVKFYDSLIIDEAWKSCVKQEQKRERVAIRAKLIKNFDPAMYPVDPEMDQKYYDFYEDFDGQLSRNVVKRSVYHAELRDITLPVVVFTPPMRDATLIRRLRDLSDMRKLLTLKSITISHFNAIYSIIAKPLPICCEMQMDKDGVVDTNIVEAGNVTLVEAREESVAAPISQCVDLTQYSSSDVSSDYNIMVDRFLLVNNFDWNTADATGVTIFKMDLPRDAILTSVTPMCRTPNFMPFLIHRYAKFDMEIKIQINSNKFQVGQLQCSWFYSPKFDSNFANRENIYSASQVEHVLISASASNEATLYIPYMYHLPLIHTKRRSDMPLPLDLGTLYLRVLNPLCIGANGPSVCYGSVFIRFLNCVFTGMLSGDIDPIDINIACEPQMMRSIIDGGVSALLDQYLPDTNRDNPSNPIPPRYIMPTASHSWSFGTGISEPLHSLRLDARGQVPHPQNSVDEFKISDTTRKFGLLTTFEWTSQYKEGNKIFSCDASPLLTKTSYPLIKAKNNYSLNCYALPPVSVIASMFNFWRGTIEFRFDVIASMFHTGRLLFAYVPGATESTNISINKARNGPHIVFTLQENHQFTYDIPFISNKVFWPKRYTGNFSRDDVIAPSRLYVFVLNPLVAMQSVVDHVAINVYIRGGYNFEVAIPIQPCIGLSFNNNVLYSSTELIHAIDDANWPYYAGTYFGFVNSRALCLRDKTTSGGRAWFESKYEKRDDAYYYELMEKGKAGSYYDSVGSVHEVEWGILLIDGTEFYIMAICVNETSAKDAALYIKKGGKVIDGIAKGWFIADVSTTSNTWGEGNPGWAPKASKGFDFVVVTADIGEADRVNAVYDTGSRLQSTDFGRMLFGERFFSMKDVCRRYQTYCSFNVDISVAANIGQCAVIVPLMPQGLDLTLGTVANINHINNRCRDGHIPITLSGFRWYRGGLRFRLVIPANDNVVVWIQHRPDRKLRNRNSMPCTEIVTAEAVANHTYASYLQLTRVNGIIEFEVPFYQPGVYNLLQQPLISKTDEMFYGQLGELSIGFVFNQKKDIKSMKCSMYYSIADDFDVSTFQGFPPMLFLDDIDDAIAVEPQGPEKKSFFDILRHPVDYFAEAAVDSVSTAVGDKVDSLKDGISKAVGPAGEALKDNSVLRNIIYSIIHCSVSKKITTIAWSIVTIFIEIGLFTMDNASKIVLSVVKWLQIIKSDGETTGETKCENPKESVECVPNSDGSEQRAAQGFLTLLWTALCGIFTINVRKPKSFGDWQKMIMTDSRNVLSTGNSMFAFLKNILSVFDDMYEWFLRKTSSRYNDLRCLQENYSDMKNWCTEVLYLTDPVNKQKLGFDVDLQDRVYIAYEQGVILTSSLVNSTNVKGLAIIMKCMNDVCKLKDELIAQGLDPYVRKLPFTIWLYGQPGVGKSTLSNLLAKELIAEQLIPVPTSLICDVNPASKFWDQCDRQPVLRVDDLFAVGSEQILSDQLCMLFAVVSPIVLCPPKAHLEEKKLRYNPELFIINSNKCYVSYPNIDSSAIHRRRDLLVRAKLKVNGVKKEGCLHCEKGYAISHSDVTYEMLSDYHHLTFSFTDNILKATGVASNMYDADFNKECDYPEFIAICKEKFAANRVKENEAFTLRLQQLNELRTNIDDGSFSLTQKRLIQNEEVQRAIRDYCEGSFVDMCSVGVKNCKTWTQDFIARSLRFNWYIRAKKEYDEAKIDKYATMKPAVLSNDYPVNYNPFSAIDEEAASGSNVRPQIGEITIACLAGYNIGTYGGMVLRRHLNYYDFSGDIKNIPYDMQHFIIAMQDGIITKEMFKELCKSIECEIAGNGAYPANKHIGSSTFLIFSIYLTSILLLLKTTSVSKRNWKYVISRASSWRGASKYNVDCFHKNVPFNKFTYNTVTKCMSYQGMGGDCEGNCFMHSVLIEHYFYDIYLETNYIQKYNYIKKNFDLLPAFYGRGDVPVFPEYDTYFSQFTTIIEFHAKHSFSGIIYKIYSVLKTLLPYLIGIGSIVMLSSFLYTEMKQEYDECDVDALNNKAAFIRAGHAYIADEKEKERSIQAKYLWCEDQGVTSYNVNTKVKLQPVVPKITVVSNSGCPQLDVVISRIRRNTIIITIVIDMAISHVEGIVLEGRKLLFVRHFIDSFKTHPPHAKYYGRFVDTPTSVYKYGIQFDLIACKYHMFGQEIDDHVFNTNVCILELPLCFPECKSLLKFIAPAQKHQYLNGKGLLVSNNTIYAGINFKRNSEAHNITAEPGCDKVIMTEIYTYQIGGRGLCGSLLLSDHLETPIIGYHVAGRGVTYGVSEILVKEMFTDECAPIRINENNSFIIPEFDCTDLPKLEFSTAIFPLAIADKISVAHQIGTTSYIPSLIYGDFPITTEPNPLMLNDPRLPAGCSPLTSGVEHLGKPPIDFPDRYLDNAGEDLLSVLISAVKPVRLGVGVIDIGTAIVGNPDIQGFEPLEWTTSEGYPLSRIRPHGVAGKQWLFNLQNTARGYNLLGIHPELANQLAISMSFYNKGIRPFTVFVDYLKDTCIDINKCKIPGKTRIFSISPVQFTILFRQYFSDFTASYQNARFNAEHGIGINCDGVEWTELASILMSKGGDIICGDYKNFGPGLMIKAARKAFDIILAWYASHGANEVDNRVRNIMADEICNSIHLVSNIFYRTPCGIPSGSPITTPLNSLVNSLYIRCMYQYIVEEINLVKNNLYCSLPYIQAFKNYDFKITDFGFKTFHNNVKIITYGDDVCIAVTPLLREWFNTESLSQAFSNFNIVFTDVDKSDVIIKTRNIHNCSFLKRTFKKHPDNKQWLASLDYNSIYSCLNWIKKKGSYELNTLENCSMALELCYGRGHDDYLLLSNKITKSLSERNIKFNCDTWYDKDIRIWKE